LRCYFFNFFTYAKVISSDAFAYATEASASAARADAYAF
jgi:hypothetical protein